MAIFNLREGKGREEKQIRRGKGNREEQKIFHYVCLDVERKKMKK